MAGISGIVLKKNNSDIIIYERAFRAMLGKLSLEPTQLKAWQISSIALFGNVLAVSESENHHFIHNKEYGLYIAIEGLVFVDDNEKETLKKKYNNGLLTHDNQWIPFLFHRYNDEIVHHITGWYNIFIYHEPTRTCLLFNDRLGYLPLYIFESDSVLLFSSRIESILASGLMPRKEFDQATFAEHLFFNYPLSDSTYVRGITTLPNAFKLSVNDGVISSSKYWSMGELFDIKALNEKESFDQMNTGLRNAINKFKPDQDQFISFSLTGGWDSRVVLSYLLPEYRHNLSTYSFGAPGTDDITIPSYIAKKENLNYQPFVLDEAYLVNSFINQATDTIELSNGTRGYKRAHYLYAIRQVAQSSGLLFTGIFGDEVFKVAQAAGGEVLSKNAVKFLESNFDIDQSVNEISGHSLFDYLNGENRLLIQEITSRLQTIHASMNQYDTISQKYYVLRFEYNLRKYFGCEAGSYNDFVSGFSPYIDHDFLKGFAKTKYFGTRFPFNSNSLGLKKQATKLYYEITRANYPALTAYPSARGYSMKDAVTLSGQVKILVRKYLLKRNISIDGFNTKPTDNLFFEKLIAGRKSNNSVFKQPAAAGLPSTDKVNSLFYWSEQIANKYF